MNSPHILIVEDDENLRLALADNLEDEGYRVTSTASGAEARRWVLDDGIAADLVVLDIMLPDDDGYSLCRDLRARRVETPILMLTARTLEDDLIRGLDAGADDFLTKPYRLRELLARVRALLRRNTGLAGSTYRFGSFSLDVEARSLRDGSGETMELTRTEFDLLALFLRCQGKALTRNEILDEVWGKDVVIDVRTVDNFVLSLKKKLGWNRSSPFQFRSLRGVGYRMEVDHPGAVY